MIEHGACSTVRFYDQVSAVFCTHGFISGLFSELPTVITAELRQFRCAESRGISNCEMLSCITERITTIRSSITNLALRYIRLRNHAPEAKRRSGQQKWTAETGQSRGRCRHSSTKSRKSLSTERADGDFGYLQGSLSPERQTSLPGTNSTLRTLNCG